ncbi:hypothetical protein [Gemmatimonas sp.]|uniref:hypothetical protein n=1 Tax=Gemmatimonas sp. TaxID=1962908 RepID=UPI0033423097
MIFPAWDSLDADARVKMRHAKIYRWCRLHLDFVQVRYGKREAIATFTGLHAADVTRVLRDLVAWGYLHEHGRDAGEAKRFTLCYSRGEETPPSGSPPEAGVAA